MPRDLGFMSWHAHLLDFVQAVVLAKFLPPWRPDGQGNASPGAGPTARAWPAAEAQGGAERGAEPGSAVSQQRVLHPLGPGGSDGGRRRSVGAGGYGAAGMSVRAGGRGF